ncbi:hypothetical protein EI94DRAFT_844720 [Lactarius quietus]|nr:hypothetical protein EI94DRAFT_844720 [Lactarius quietus]
MPFSTDMNWPQGLLNIFNVCRNRNAPFESRYHGPYGRLFNYAMIEGSFTFFLTRQTAPDDTSLSDAVYFLIFMVILNQDQKPVLIAEIKDDKWANEPDKRQKADAQIRQRYDQMLFNCPIPHLYGLSLLGTSLRVYCGDKVTGEVTPDFVDRPYAHRVLPPDFLAGEWDLDILSPEGLAKMQDVVAYIKAEAANVVG